MFTYFKPLTVFEPLCLHFYGNKAEAWLQHSKVGSVGQVSKPAPTTTSYRTTTDKY
jgi:hypothetical protein